MALMHWNTHWKALTAALPILLMAGCVEYTVETTLNPDGSGHRSVRVEAKDVEDLAEYHLSTGDFTDLLSLSEGRGWNHETHVSGGDTTHVFRQERQMGDLAAWSALDGQIRIAGALPSQASSTVGYVTLGEVQFRNQVLVGSTKTSAGDAAFRYMESFLWEEAVEALVEVLVGQIDQNLIQAYPPLPSKDRGEVLGLARANLLQAVEDGVLDSSGDDEDRLWGRATDQTTSTAIRLVKRWAPEVDEESLREQLDLFSGEAEEELIEALVRTIPGFNLAINSVVSFRLIMPGRITNTNAHERDGNTLTWDFSPADALTAPVVILAESVVGR